MKNFRVQILAYGYSADFNVSAEDTAEGIEKSILDKLGKNEVKFESNGFTRKDRKWIPMRRLQMTEDLYNTKRSLELEWQQEHLKDGKHNIRMIEINKKIQDIIKEIVAIEFEADTLQTKIDEVRTEVSIAT